eukprot:UN23452
MDNKSDSTSPPKVPDEKFAPDSTSHLWANARDQIKKDQEQKLDRLKLIRVDKTKPHDDSSDLSSDQDELEWEDLKIDAKDRIGIGGFAEVFKTTYQGKERAVKRIMKQKLNENLVKEFSQEVSIMRNLEHEHIVKFIGACTKPPNLCVVP